MKYEIGDVRIRDGKDGTAIVSRRSMLRDKVSTMIMHGAAAIHIYEWMRDRANGKRTKLVQDAFPLLSAGECEFLISGITPEERNANFKDEEDAE